MTEKILITSSVAVFSTRRSSYTVMKTHDFFTEIVAALKNKDTKLAYELYVTKKPKSKRVEIRGNDFYFDEQKFDPVFAEAYQLAKIHGLSIGKLDDYFQNLMKNPSPISVHAFTGFTAKSRMPITDRGTFLAYKKIRHSTYRDIHSGRFDNRPGAVCAMDRKLVDIVQDHECSTGFHVCSHTYLGKFGGPSDVEIVVEVHPKDVVAVPPDYEMTKMRVASYRVLCTLPYFKKQLLSYEADALGNIPIFNTEFTKSWDVMSDVTLKSDIETFMTPEAWLESRENAK
jgi:hypothetical protein